MARFRVGTSGWQYKHWRGVFYPAGLAVRRWLDYYAARFDTVEINNSFYRLPAVETLEKWRDSTPPGFLFAVKASRYLTHYKRLADPEEPIARLFSRITALGPKLGPVLFQLPPKWQADADRLSTFLRRLPRGPRYVFEFRDPSWETPAIWRLLEKHGAARCVFELAGYTSPLARTADFVYLRLHGPLAAKYAGCYHDAALHCWARWLVAEAPDCGYVYFDNDQAGYAAANAAALRQWLEAGRRATGNDRRPASGARLRRGGPTMEQ